MAKVPLPERGQPIDVTYIYELAKAVNDLSSQVSSATYKTTTVSAGTAGNQNVKTSEAKFVGGYKEVTTKTDVGVAQEVKFDFSYSDFKYAPIVTATPLNVGGTTAGSDVSIILKTVTTSRVTGTIQFRSNGNASVAVNLIIVGVPT